MSTTDSNSLHAAAAVIVGEENARAEGRHVHVAPSSASEISQLAVCAADHRATLIPVGKGRRTMPTDDVRPQLLLDMRRMSYVLHLDRTSLVVHAQAGITGLELEELLGKRGLTLGAFAPAGLASTLGGLLAVRTPGKSSRQHGTLENMVLGVDAVLSDGRTVHTRVAPRRASGPDFARLMCGSEGTLGIITSAHLRVHKKPESRLLVAFKLPNVDEALTAVRLAMREEASPEALRIYDAAEAKAHLGDVCEESEAILVAATSGPTSLAACDRNLIASAVSAVGGQRADDAIAKKWWDGRSVLRPSEGPNLQVSATPGMLSPVYQAIAKACTEAGLRFRAHASRFDRDGGVLFVSVTDASGATLDKSSEKLVAISEAAESAGAYLLGKPNASLQTFFERVRAELDPENLLNPGVLR